LNSSFEHDLSRRVYRQKMALWHRQQYSCLTIVCPSQWIAGQVAKSPIFCNTPIRVIPTGINTEIFSPIKTADARRILNLPQDKPLILFGANRAFADTRKGGQLLFDTMQAVAHHYDTSMHRPEVVIFGTWRDANTISLPLKTHALGHFINDLSLPLVYSACDVFVSLSLEDNLPNTIIEAFACGTPCVAFSAGGIPEIVDHKNNGYLSGVRDTKDLAHGICWVIKHNRGYRTLSENARHKAREQFNLSDSVNKYIHLIRETTHRDNPTRHGA
jgi:glycosyltransferase involved in cell wall biosynthesis